MGAGTEGTRAVQPPADFRYTDCGERATLLWLLDYHFGTILAALDGVPHEALFRHQYYHWGQLETIRQLL